MHSIALAIAGSLHACLCSSPISYCPGAGPADPLHPCRHPEDLHSGSQPFSCIRALDLTWRQLQNREAQAGHFAGSLTQGLNFF